MARVLAELGERGKQVSDTTPRRAPGALPSADLAKRKNVVNGFFINGR